MPRVKSTHALQSLPMCVDVRLLNKKETKNEKKIKMDWLTQARFYVGAEAIAPKPRPCHPTCDIKHCLTNSKHRHREGTPFSIHYPTLNSSTIGARYLRLDMGEECTLPPNVFFSRKAPERTV